MKLNHFMMYFNPRKLVMMFFPFLLNKVGEQEEKLAEGIKLYALLATATSKRTVLSDLITVSL